MEARRMKGRIVARRISSVFAAMLCASVVLVTGGQALSTLPRTADGKPDLSGVWQAMNSAAWDIQNHAARKGVPAGRGVVVGNEIPYQPWAAARQKENLAHSASDDLETKCN